MEIRKSGMISIVGRPNVGKSTLTNALVGEKIAIVTNKPQTTRNRITAILNRGESQFVFVDTPGLHKARTRLGDYMVKVVKESVADVDAVMLLVEPIPNIGAPEQQLIDRIKTLGCPSVLVINKVDTLEQKEKLLEVIQVYTQAHDFTAVVPISAKDGSGLKDLMEELKKLCLPGGHLFPEDTLTDQPERVIASEIVREKVLRLLDQEVPHGVAAVTERMKDRDGILDLDVTIYCEKSGHKGILIGKGGAMLKKIGTAARQDLERFFDCKVNLQLWVKVKEDWRQRPETLQSLGFSEKDLEM